jgi:hypothetical protein
MTHAVNHCASLRGFDEIALSTTGTTDLLTNSSTACRVAGIGSALMCLRSGVKRLTDARLGRPGLHVTALEPARASWYWPAAPARC